MRFIGVLSSNVYLNVGILSWFIAQFLKVVLTFLTTKKINLERLLGNGGMPSSHSAFTVSIAVMIARTIGFDSAIFAISVAFALVVMTDAMGVRRAAGEQARALNMIFEISDIPILLGLEKPKSVSVEVPLEVLEKHENKKEDSQESPDEEYTGNVKLKELLGHTPLEVFGGFLLGIFMGMIMPAK